MSEQTSSIGVLEQFKATGANQCGGRVIQFVSEGFIGPYCAALTITNYVPSTGGDNSSAGGNASYGVDSYNWCNNGGVAKPGALVGVQGFCNGDQSFNIGVSGAAWTFTPNVTVIGLTGVAGNYGKEAIGIGVYAGLNGVADNDKELTPETCALLVDARSSGASILIARSGGEKKFCIGNDGAILASAPAGSAPCRLKLGLATDAAGHARLALEINGQNFFVNLTTE